MTDATTDPQERPPDSAASGGDAGRAEYRARINRVIDHIDRHLADDLSLGALAQVACFSPFHFHRVFRALTGEPPARFVRRLRLERAAQRLVHDRRASITAIALDAGFATPEAFTRAFREGMGASPSEWRRAGKHGRASRKRGQAERKNGQAPPRAVVHPDLARYGRAWRMEMEAEMETNARTQVRVEVQELPPQEVAYVRHIGPYQGDAELFGRLFHQLFGWAGPRGLVRFPETRALCVYHDDPNVTEDDHLRVSVCLTVPAETAADGEIGRMTVPGGLYAVARFELRSDEYAAAWDALYGAWLPASGFQPDDRPSFEQMIQGPDQHPEGKHVVAIHVPVRPL